MDQEYICPKCKQPIETGAEFCGNCGIQIAYSSQGVPVSEIPDYAIAYPHPKQHWAALALAIGVIGMASGLLIAVIGVGLGLIGIVLSTTSYRGSSKGLRLSSLIVSSLAVLIGLSVWVNAVTHDPVLHSQKVVQAGESNGIASLKVMTPCYSVGFESALNVNNAKDSCTMNAYNGANLTNSTNVYRVLGSNVTGISQSNFAAEIKPSIESDMRKNIPGFSVTGQALTTFSGDSAYYIQANDPTAGVAVIEEGVLHNTVNTQNNLFIIVHVARGQTTDLNGLEKAWQWND